MEINIHMYMNLSLFSYLLFALRPCDIFYLVTHQVLHCQSRHTEVRARCVEFLRKNRKMYEAVRAAPDKQSLGTSTLNLKSRERA